jgi:hypothetical protein
MSEESSFLDFTTSARNLKAFMSDPSVWGPEGYRDETPHDLDMLIVVRGQVLDVASLREIMRLEDTEVVTVTQGVAVHVKTDDLESLDALFIEWLEAQKWAQTVIRYEAERQSELKELLLERGFTVEDF